MIIPLTLQTQKVTQVTKKKKKSFSLLSISHFTVKEKIVTKKQITIFLTKFCSDFGNGFCVYLKII